MPILGNVLRHKLERILVKSSKSAQQSPNIQIHMEPNTFYVWVGGSCDYGHPERWGGGSYIVEQENQVIAEYTTADVHTTEFRMMLHVMINALNKLPNTSKVVFLTNVSYIKQAIDSYPTKGTDNQDLIHDFIKTKGQQREVNIKIVSYHKYPQLAITHQKAHEAMCELRNR